VARYEALPAERVGQVDRLLLALSSAPRTRVPIDEVAQHLGMDRAVLNRLLETDARVVVECDSEYCRLAVRRLWPFVEARSHLPAHWRELEEMAVTDDGAGER
jgi:hypothetical protein